MGRFKWGKFFGNLLKGEKKSPKNIWAKIFGKKGFEKNFKGKGEIFFPIYGETQKNFPRVQKNHFIIVPKPQGF